ncbi:hypothetical protein CORC01_05301 [Colletotrichum orchidophilum]|uniref:Beta-lactamase-like ARB-00930-like C-terminal domain-containing protein n=1 Tax=Colletotrichum orchidophilum TaxID=1209926 RepID=A0A1G4BDN0_9PEZI|nr:uncharacterized protein CORC01_05301 [Colletotrichum orchidophilum]OHE99501.1 hypothetical protein CORC01_05301 [Colletotrichum orchidophilum]
MTLEAFQDRINRTGTFDSILVSGVFEPLNMTNSGLLSSVKDSPMVAQDLNMPSHAQLSSHLARRHTPLAATDISNLRNGVGRPWEIEHAGQHANSSIVDIFTKKDLMRHYRSYFGLVPDFNAGFAILAHDTEAARRPDLKVYADIVSLAVVRLQKLATAEMAARYVVNFQGPEKTAAFNTSRDGPGMLVSTLKAGNVDPLAQVADAAGIKLEDLDFRLYPANVVLLIKMQFFQLFLAAIPFIGVSQAVLCSCDRSTTVSITCCPDIQKWSGYECEPADQQAYTDCCADQYSTTTFCRDSSI